MANSPRPSHVSPLAQECINSEQENPPSYRPFSKSRRDIDWKGVIANWHHFLWYSDFGDILYQLESDRRMGHG